MEALLDQSPISESRTLASAPCVEEPLAAVQPLQPHEMIAVGGGTLALGFF
jgi:hypothetical protein